MTYKKHKDYMLTLNIKENIAAFLKQNQDANYKAFQAKLIPTIDQKKIIGVRTPALRSYAKRLASHPQVDSFLSALPHKTFEENQLHAFVLGQIKDYNKYIEALRAFLPYLDNWATCDQLPVQRLSDQPDQTLLMVQNWIADERPYIARFGIGVLLCLFLDEEFASEHLQWIADMKSSEYYVNMMRAWYVAEALVKQPEAALALLKSHQLDAWTHNKAIQKARESRRISREMKETLQNLK